MVISPMAPTKCLSALRTHIQRAQNDKAPTTGFDKWHTIVASTAIHASIAFATVLTAICAGCAIVIGGVNCRQFFFSAIFKIIPNKSPNRPVGCLMLTRATNMFIVIFRNTRNANWVQPYSFCHSPLCNKWPLVFLLIVTMIYLMTGCGWNAIAL